MYYIVYSFLWLLSLIPFRIFYIIGDGIYLILFYVIRYRRDVVMSNLKIAFPSKSDSELLKISKQFYENFVDQFIETVKLISMTEKEFRKRVTSDTTDVMKNICATGKNVQLVSGHFFNFEYANLFYALHTPIPYVGVYMPIHNKIINRIFFNFRKKYGTHLIAATRFRREIIPFLRHQYCLVLGADQNPGNLDKAYWVSFFNKMTPFVPGPEKGAKINDCAIVLASFHKIKRGYYKTTCMLLTDNPASMAHGEITKAMVRYLEQQIELEPANYLWSHRRWRFEFDEKKYGHLVVS